MKSMRSLKTARRQEGLEKIQAGYAKALAEGNALASSRVIEDLVSQRCSLDEIYSRVIVPSLVTIGDLWCGKDIGVAEEHLATQIVLNHLDRLGSMFAWRERRFSYRVLVGCVEGEHHWLGARMFADLCSSHGWTVDFLGPDVPDADLVEIVKKRTPHVVALSATMTQGREHARRVVGKISTQASAPRIILGGHAIISGGERQSIAGAATASTLVDGIKIAMEFLRAHRPRAVLKEYLSALGLRVRNLRLKKGWTQEQLAETAGVTRVCIVAVEGGKQNVSMDIVIRLANALGVLPERLMIDDDDPSLAAEQRP
jgi:methanogenic corrinoid protein MtbC1/DNA-binding XRE family transcriptional regulator